MDEVKKKEVIRLMLELADLVEHADHQDGCAVLLSQGREPCDCILARARKLIEDSGQIFSGFKKVK